MWNMGEYGLNIMPLICPVCSSRLQVGAQEVVFYCRNCRNASELSGNAIVKREILHAAGTGDIFLPFWTVPFRFAASGISVATRNDFSVFTGNIDRENGSENSMRPPVLYLPAFQMLAPQVIRLGRQMTLRMPVLQAAGNAPKSIEQIIISEGDVDKMAEAVIISATPEQRRKDYGFLASSAVRTGPGRLITIPFAKGHGGRYYSRELNLEF